MYERQNVYTSGWAAIKLPPAEGTASGVREGRQASFTQNISGQTIFNASAIHFNIYLTKQEPQALRKQRYIIHIRLYTIQYIYIFIQCFVFILF